MICSLSGQEVVEPVVSPAGNVFEKAVIEKYLAQNDKCPVTGDPLSVEELISIKVSTVAQPRPVSAASIPGLLKTFQNEWDAIVLETFTLKKQLDTARQELANALYQNDASCRVIARLIKERDEARAALIALKDQVHSQPQAQAQENMETDSDGFSKDLANEMTALSKELSGARASRDTSAAPKEQVQKFSQKLTRSIHKTSPAGILSVNVHAMDDTKVVTGGMDCTAIVFDRAEKKKLATLSGHSKAVTKAAFHPVGTLIATGSRDNTIRIWTAPTNSTNYNTHVTLSNHSEEITSLKFHPMNQYLISTSLDKTWGFHNLERGKTIVNASSDSIKSSIISADVHPDCLLLGTGQEDGSVSLWNITNQQVVMSFGEHSGGTRAINFSENGYQAITAGKEDIILWDLRNIKSPVKSLNLDKSFDLSNISLNYSSHYLAACGSVISIYDSQSLEEITSLNNHSNRVMDVTWNRAGTRLYSVSMDRSLKVFE